MANEGISNTHERRDRPESALFAAVVILMIVAALAKVVTDLLSAAHGDVSGGEWIARGAGMAILVIRIFAALDQLQIAPVIVNGLFYALLAIIVGVAILPDPPRV
jgi:formate hydrogenlyase subunit 3/multisubunit Na+/H+ antiporter MnhD subunit